jgi:hypothetical protein
MQSTSFRTEFKPGNSLKSPVTNAHNYQGSLFIVPSSCSGNAESLWRGHLVCAQPGLIKPIQDRAERQAKPSVEVLFTRQGPCVSVSAPISSVATANLDFALSHMSLIRSRVVIPLRDVS